MATLAVSDAEIIRLAWAAEDRARQGCRCLAERKLGPGRRLELTRIEIEGRRLWVLIVRTTSCDHVWDYRDGDAAWRAAVGWDGKGEPEGFARYRRR